METTMRRRPASPWARWYLPGVALAIGVAYLLTQGAGGDWSGGAISFAIMAALAVACAFGSRWDVIRQLRADTRDERGAAIDLRATAFAGIVVIVAVIVAFMVELARGGGDAGPYALIGAIGGVSYVAALVVLRRRG
jgi:hypothetical protein